MAFRREKISSIRKSFEDIFKEKVHHKNDVRKGATAILVSHNLQIIEKYCNKVIWLDKGKIKKEGGMKEVVEEYKG